MSDMQGAAAISRREFLVLYDYGQGGSWALVRADSAGQVRARYPEVRVFDEWPAMVSAEMLDAIRAAGVTDVEGPATGWLAQLEADRPAALE